jgi:hypothetical protein
MRRLYIVAVAIAIVVTVMTSSVAARSAPELVRATTSGTTDWPEYEHDITGSGYTTDTGITVQNASTLALRAGWPLPSANGAMITAQPIESGGYLYWGSWDGVEHGIPVNGGPGWATSLGTLTYPPNTACSNSGVHGVGDSGVVASGLNIQGDPDPVLFVAGGGNDSIGGGWASMYALDALTGSILWQTQIAPSPDDYLWSSPLFFQVPGQSPSIYEGVADVGEPCPLVQGAVVQIDALTGAVQHTFYTAPSGCTGATVWGSLTIDAGAIPPAVFAVTGNRGACNKPKEPYSFAIVKLDATDLSLLDSWQVPKAQRVGSDDDFGSVPILFQDSVGTMFVGAVNKNGIFYIWNRNDLAVGPVYSLAVANHNVADIAPAAFDGTVLYIGTPAITVNGVRQPGSIQAYNVDNLPTLLWETKLTAPVIASVTAANVGSAEIVVVNAGHKTLIINASTGAIVKTLQAESVGGTKGFFWGAPIIANGVLYEGDTQGFLYAYSPGGQ